LTPKEFVWMGG